MEQRQLQWTRTASDALALNGPGGSGGAPAEPPSELLRQARGWSAVARDAYETLARGEDAERELQRRRNRSGQ